MFICDFCPHPSTPIFWRETLHLKSGKGNIKTTTAYSIWLLVWSLVPLGRVLFSELRLGGGSPNRQGREGVTAGLGRQRMGEGVGTNGNICIDSLWMEFFQQDTGPPGEKQAAGGAGKKVLKLWHRGLGEGSRALPRAALQGPGLADSGKTPGRSVPGNQTQREGTGLQCGVATPRVQLSTERSRRLIKTSGSQGNFLSQDATIGSCC